MGHQRMRRSENGCPYQVTIKYGHIGNRHWYLSSNGLAIWYSGTGWIVGTKDGKGGHSGVFFNTDDYKCPHQPAWNWTYFVPAIKKIIAAGRGMSIYKKT